MTNLLCSIVVTVVTNVTEIQPPRSPWVIIDGYGNGGGTYGEPQEKKYVTTCKELTILRFEWRGQREIIEERILWQTNQVFRLDWVPK